MYVHSSGMKNGLSRKDELFNELATNFKSRGLDFPRCTVDTDGQYFVQVIFFKYLY